MATVVELHVRNIDFSNLDTLGALLEVGNVSISSMGRVMSILVFVDDGENVIACVLNTVERIRKLLPESEFVRVAPDLVAASDIASRIGRSREAVRQWAVSLKNDFPVEFTVLDGGQKLWRWVDVAEWLCRVKHYDVNEDLPTAADIAKIDGRLSEFSVRNSDSWIMANNAFKEIPGEVRLGPTGTAVKTAPTSYNRPGGVRGEAGKEVGYVG